MELATAFEDESFTVLEAASAEDALVILQARYQAGVGADLLVTDIRLSGVLTGWDLATEARELDERIAVMYVSANPPAPSRFVRDSVFIDKPALITQVLDVAERLLA